MNHNSCCLSLSADDGKLQFKKKKIIHKQHISLWVQKNPHQTSDTKTIRKEGIKVVAS